MQEYLETGGQSGLTGSELLELLRMQLMLNRISESESSARSKSKLKQAEDKERLAVKQAEDKERLALDEARIRETDLILYLCSELEKPRLEHKKSLRVEELKTGSESASAASSSSNITVANGWHSKKFGLGVGKFDSDENNLDAFISHFEMIAKAYELPENLWSIKFSEMLRSTSLEVYKHLDNNSQMDYNCLILALRKMYGITEGGYRKKLYTAKPYHGECQSDFVLRLRHCLESGLEKLKLLPTYEGLFELMISQVYY